MKSIFFVPSNRPEFFEKASKFDCNLIVFDLEDAIGEGQIKQGVLNILNYIELFKKDQRKYIRIDSLDYVSTLNATAKLAIDGYMVPKFEGYQVIDHILNISPDAEIILLIETVKGFQKLSQVISFQTDNIKGVAFGAEDYCQSMRCNDNLTNLLFARTRIIEAARVYGIDAYDTIYPFINDDEGFCNSLINARDMGFDGKLIIHPRQLNLFNKEKDNNLFELNKIVCEYEENLKNGRTVSVINGRIYERNHIDSIKRKISEIIKEHK
jgi:citrate lyase subunit beta / citryl-CoA lyase